MHAQVNVESAAINRFYLDEQNTGKTLTARSIDRDLVISRGAQDTEYIERLGGGVSIEIEILKI